MEFSISLSHFNKLFLITDAVLQKDSLKKILECKKCKRKFILSAQRSDLMLSIGTNFKLLIELDHPNACENIEVVESVETVNDTENTNSPVEEVRVVSITPDDDNDDNSNENQVGRDSINSERLFEINSMDIAFQDDILEAEKIAAKQLFSQVPSQWPSKSQVYEEPETQDCQETETNDTAFEIDSTNQPISSPESEQTETQQLLNEIKLIKDAVSSEKIFQISFSPFYILFIDINLIKWISAFYKNTKSDIQPSVNIYYIRKPSNLKTISGKPLHYQSIGLSETGSKTEIIEVVSSLEIEETFHRMQPHQYFLSIFKNIFLPITKCWPPFNGLIILQYNIDLISKFLDEFFGKSLAEYINLRYDSKIQPLLAVRKEDFMQNLIKDINVFEISEKLKMIVIYIMLQFRCEKSQNNLKDKITILIELLLNPKCHSNMVETQNVPKAENRDYIMEMCNKIVEKSSTALDIGDDSSLTSTKLYQMIQEIEESIKDNGEFTEDSQPNEFYHPELARFLIKNYLCVLYIWDIEIQV